MGYFLLLFSMILSILTFDFNLIFGLICTFQGPIGLFLGLGNGSKTVLGSTHVVGGWWFPAITLSQPSYSYSCFVVGVVVVVGL